MDIWRGLDGAEKSGRESSRMSAAICRWTSSGDRKFGTLRLASNEIMVEHLGTGGTRGTGRTGRTLEPTLTTPFPSPPLALQKTATAVAHVKRGKGLIKLNGSPLELVEPEILRYKAFEPVLLLGKDKFANVDIRVRVKGGGHTSQIYGGPWTILVRQAVVGLMLGMQPSGKRSPRASLPTTRNSSTRLRRRSFPTSSRRTTGACLLLTRVGWSRRSLVVPVLVRDTRRCGEGGMAGDPDDS